MLAGESDISRMYVLLKFMATWITSWSGVPGGIFAPSLSVGAGFGQLITTLFPDSPAGAIVLLGMIGYFTGVVRAPMTSVRRVPTVAHVVSGSGRSIPGAARGASAPRVAVVATSQAISSRVQGRVMTGAPRR